MVTKAINVTSTWTEVGEGPPTGTDDMFGPVKIKVVMSSLVEGVTFCTKTLPFTDISVNLVPNCACCSILTPEAA